MFYVLILFLVVFLVYELFCGLVYWFGLCVVAVVLIVIVLCLL